MHSETLIRFGGCPGWSVFAGRTGHFVGSVMQQLNYDEKWKSWILPKSWRFSSLCNSTVLSYASLWKQMAEINFLTNLIKTYATAGKCLLIQKKIQSHITLRSRWAIYLECKCSTPSRICLIKADASSSLSLSFSAKYSNSSPPATLKQTNDLHLENYPIYCNDFNFWTDRSEQTEAAFWLGYTLSEPHHKKTCLRGLRPR